MKGYIYLLKEKGHKNTYKIGRTNNLNKRLEYYNSGDISIPTYLLENEGDRSKAYQNENGEWQVKLNRSSKDYVFEYIHTIKVKDSKTAENILLENVLGHDYYFRGQWQEWFNTKNINLIIEVMNEIGQKY
jgi:predicted GIY-YIG superfamily endonuclease